MPSFARVVGPPPSAERSTPFDDIPPGLHIRRSTAVRFAARNLDTMSTAGGVMKTWAYRVLTAAGLLLAATNAGAFPLRSPQVPFNPGPLQAYLNVVDPGINVTTQQLDAQVWSVSVTGNAELTLTLKQGLGQGDAFGV